MHEIDEAKEKRRKVIEVIVQHPLNYLRANRQLGKNCLDCILLLREVRQEIHADDLCVIANPDPIYAQFHGLPNHSVEHYVALFGLLKAAGFNKIEVNAAILDDLPYKWQNESRGNTIRAYLNLTNKALDVIYDL